MMVGNNYTKNESLSLTFKHLELIQVGYDPTVHSVDIVSVMLSLLCTLVPS